MRARPKLAVLVALIAARTLFAANPIQIENAKPGSPGWDLNVEANGEIEGYPSATSVNHGSTIDIYVNTRDPSYLLEVFRMGWYGGLGARRVLGPVSLPGVAQTIPAPDATTGIIECHWTNPYTINVASDWTTGVYLVRLTAGTSGKQKFVKFVVRDDTSTANHYFQSAVTTSEAYNNWGGKSLYSFNSTNSVPAVKVSFDRPSADGAGTGTFLWQWEYNMVRFLEREGYDVAYCTNIDTARRGSLLLNHKSFLVVGHDEYISWDMRTNIETARTNHVNLAFFASNTCYWQIRLEANSSGVADRTIVGYKEQALTKDPYALDGIKSNDYLITTNWRGSPVNDPETKLVGVMYFYDPVNSDIVIDDITSAPWVFANTGLKQGDHLRGLLGYEVDAIGTGSPTNIIRLGHSPYQNTKVSPAVTAYSDMTVYTASGATVFATGSMQWAWGVDSWNSGATLVNPAAQQITRNVLHQFAGSSASNDCQQTLSPTSSSVSAGSDASTIAVASSSFCSWTATSNATWLTITSGATGSGNGTVAYSWTANPGAPRTATITVGGATLTVSQGACSYSLSTTSDSFAASGGSDSILVSAPAGCAWTASSDQTWATIISGASGSGNGTVAISIAANAGAARDATLTIGGIAVAVHQASGCTYALYPTTFSVAASGASGSATLATSAPDCAWTVISSDQWVTVTSPASGSGNATISATVSPNVGPARQATITAGSASLTINQSNGCTYSPAPSALSFTSSGGSASVAVTASSSACFWSSQSNDSWVSITSGSQGQGNGTVTIAAAPNSAGPRNGSATVAGVRVDVNQDGAPCTFTLAPSSNAVATDGGTFSVSVTTSSWCNWSASTSDAFIHITSGTSGTGNGSVSYSVDANSGTARSGSMIIAGQTLPISQTACAPVAISSQPTSTTITDGDSATLTVVASGSGPLAYQWYSGTSPIANATSASLTVTPSSTTSYWVRVTGRCGTADSTTATVTVNPCAYITAPSSFNFDASGGSGSVSITTGANCYWISSSGASWITITGGANGHANGATAFSVAANTTSSSRTSYLIVAGNTIIINQAAPCSPPSITSQPSSVTTTQGMQVTLSVTAAGSAPLSYQWFAGTTAINNATNASLTVAPSSTTTYFVRVTNACGTIDSAQATVTVTPCSYSVSPSSFTIDASGGGGSITVTTASSCSWTAASDTAWITIMSGGSGTGSGTTNFSVAANNSGSQRSGTITVAGNSVTITQKAPCFVPAVMTQPASTTTTAGNPVTLSVAASGTTPLTYQWFAGSTPIPNSNAASITVSPSSTTSYFVRITNACGSADSSAAVVTVCSYSASPASFNFDAAGGSGTITVTATSGCSWSSSSNAPWITITSSGGSSVAFTVAPNTGAARNGTLTVAGNMITVSQAACSSPSITSQPSSTTTIAGTPVTLTVAANGTAPLSYQWFAGGSPLSGQTTASITVTPAATTTYFARVTNACGTIDSAPATVTVCSYSVAPQSFTFDTSGGGGTVNVTTNASCAWSSSTTTPWITITSGASGTGNATVSFTVAANSGAARNGTLTIAGTTVGVSQAACSIPVVQSQPQSVTTTPGTSVTLSVTATGTAPLSYQWFAGSTAIANATSASVTVAPTTTTTYFARITNSCGSADSATAIVTVTQPACTPPAITSQPRSYTITAGSSTTLSVTATGTAPLSYQWFAGSNPISGQSAASITVAPAATTTYFVRITNACGTIDSIAVTVTVTPCNYNVNPASFVIDAGGASGSLSVTTSAGCSWTALSDSAWITLTGATSGTGSGTVTFSVLPNPDTASRIGGISIAHDKVTIAQSGSCAQPAITSQPQSTTIAAGQSATLQVAASGSAPLTYQWYIGTTGDTTSPIDTATSATLTITPATTTTYWVAVTNSCGVANSNSATVTVGCNFTVAPQSFTFDVAGGTASVNVKTAASCAWSASTTASWITINSGATATGNGATGFSVAPNDGAARTATLLVAGATITISQAAKVVGNLQPPANVTATATDASTVAISWSSNGASAYHVYRSADGLGYTLLASVAASSWIDRSAASNTAYLYKVRASDGTNESVDSNLDIATTVVFTDASLAGVAVKAVHFTQLRDAVNAVRALAGMTAFTFTDPDLSGMTVKTTHISELRAALNAARKSLGLPQVAFTDPNLLAGSTPIKAVHILELRAGLQ